MSIPSVLSSRKIIHCDCDCFYAAVEMRDDPALATLPWRSAAAQALQRCPDLVVIPPAMDKYRIASRQIPAIYRDYIELVEPLSLDEAYLDVSHAPHCKRSATLITQEIRRRIHEMVGITASASIAPNKFLALSRMKQILVKSL